MGVFDKIKNALFEVEYVEVDEKPKKPKKVKHVHKEKDKKKEEEKPIVKKIVLPDKNEGKVEHLQEEELKDDNFEIRPKDEVTKEKPNNTFKFMDDDDFQVDEPQIVSVYDDFDNKRAKEKIPEEPQIKENRHYKHDDESLKNDSFVDNTPIMREEPRHKEKQSRLYGVDDSYKLNVHEYGTYEKKEDKTYFRPSPIISPIYGVLDKNYKKEDVVSKKEIRITSSYSRSNVNVDDIRNKAFGRKGKNVDEEVSGDNSFEVDEEEDNLLVDLSGENDKPEVKKVTVGDAMEYFQDLGLEYNVDYVDVSKDKKEPKKNDDKLEDVIEKQITGKIDIEEIKDDNKKEVKDNVNHKGEKKEVTPKKDDSLDDDNLFDLIDSMYTEDN